MWRDKYYKKIYQRLVEIKDAFLIFCKFLQKHIEFVNQTVYNTNVNVLEKKDFASFLKNHFILTTDKICCGCCSSRSREAAYFLMRLCVSFYTDGQSFRPPV